MKNLFSIGLADEKTDTLLMELGHDYCCYAHFSQAKNEFTHIRYITFDEWEADEKLLVLLNEFNDRRYEKVVVNSGFSQALLIPQQLFAAENILLDVIYDLPRHRHFHDPVPEWQLVNTYALPASTCSILSGRFPDIKFVHNYTPSLRTFNGFVAADQIELYFTTGHFRVLVKMEQNIQLAQTYSYKTPLDVIYYLLKICYEFDLNQSEVFIIISGLVEKDSALYNELQSYFLQVHFAQEPAFRLPETELPSYYFTSLYNLAACAL